MSIRMKMLLPMILLAVLSIAAVLVTVSVVFSGYVDDTIAEEVDIAGNILQKETNDLKSQAHIVSNEIAQNEAIINAVSADNTQALLSAAEKLLLDTGMDICTITDENGKVIARVHSPEEYGDTVDQQDIILALNGQEYTGFEESTTVALAALSSATIRDKNGKLVGAVSVGCNLENFEYVDNMKELLHTEVTIFHRDTRLATTVTNTDGSRAVGTPASDAVVDAVINRGEDYAGTAKILDRSAFVAYTPLQDESGEVIGMLFTGKYTDTKSQAMFQFIGISLIVSVALLCVAIPICIYLSGKTVAPIKTLVGAAKEIALGDVNVEFDVHTKDETRQLAQAFEEMTAGFRRQADVLNAMAAGDYSVEMQTASDKDVVGAAIVSILESNNNLLSDISMAAQQVSAGAVQIADGSQALATGSTQQAATVEELSATVSQVQVQSEENTELANTAAQEMGEAGRLMGESLDFMGKLTGAMSSIETSSQEISKVIKVIDDIAFQTNILALNAAVEAARAGQHGKGFAVVADEVRSLASKSASAAKETANLIQHSVDNVQQGTGLVEQTNESLHKAGEIANSNAASIQSISELSSQQSASITEINAAINQISQVVQANSATSQQSAAAAEELSAQSSILTENVSQFKLRSHSVDATRMLPAKDE